MSDDPHIAPVLARLATTARPVLDDKVEAGQARPYHRVFAWVEVRESESIAHTSDRTVVWFYVHSVGDNDRAASTAAADARGVLLDWTPTVAGRTCFPIRMDSARPPTPDESTGRLVIDQLVVYRLESVPA